MKTFMEIKRVTDKGPTFGVFKDFNGVPFAVTLEPEWVNNLKDVSCIPFGFYKCKRVKSPRYGDTFEITGVIGRTHVLFHWGNLPRNTKACVLIAEEFGYLDGKAGILESKSTPGKGFNEFMKITKGLDSFWIRISY